MSERKKEKKLPAKEAKCLACVHESAAEGYDPSLEGVAYLLRGEEQAGQFSYFKTFGCLSSFSVRKIKTMLTRLLKNGYLQSYSPLANPRRYLMLTPIGEEAASLALKKNIRTKPQPPLAPLFNERN